MNKWTNVHLWFRLSLITFFFSLMIFARFNLHWALSNRLSNRKGLSLSSLLHHLWAQPVWEGRFRCLLLCAAWNATMTKAISGYLCLVWKLLCKQGFLVTVRILGILVFWLIYILDSWIECLSTCVLLRIVNTSLCYRPEFPSPRHHCPVDIGWHNDWVSLLLFR